MSCSEISNIIVTIGLSQLILDLLFNYFVYEGDAYRRAVREMERNKSRLDRTEFDAKRSSNKTNLKKLERAKAEHAQACAEVARQHMMPSIVSSLFFFLLLRILGTEYKGKVIGVLPFVPYNFVSRITARGLDWRDIAVEDLKAAGTTMEPKQAFSFMFVYILAGFTVKFYVNKLAGKKPPAGADGGIQTIVDSPMGRSFIKAWGIDPNDLKMD
jgi:uncharacterized membrane protein (DUF106 family)